MTSDSYIIKGVFVKSIVAKLRFREGYHHSCDNVPSVKG